MSGTSKLTPAQLAVLQALGKLPPRNALADLFGPPKPSNALADVLAFPNQNALATIASSYPGGLGRGTAGAATRSLFGSIASTKRKVFVSYHHGGDQTYYDNFCGRFSAAFNVFTDRSLDRARDSDDPEYIMRYIRENHLAGASTLIVLCGLGTRWRKYVDWEINAGLRQQMSLVGIKLPMVPIIDGGCNKPDRLQDNIDSGYAVWTSWETVAAYPDHLSSLIETANDRPKSAIDNSRARRLRNG